MVKVLHVLEIFDNAGIENYLMNAYRIIDKTLVQFDFLISKKYTNIFDEEIKEYGGSQYILRKDSIYELKKKLQEIIAQQEYDVVEVHLCTPLRFIVFKWLHDLNIKRRVCHSHSAYISGFPGYKYLVYTISKTVFSRYITDYWSCSIAAGEWLYRRRDQAKLKVIRNGIDTKKYRFNNNTRKRIRNKYKMGDILLLGQVGRITEQKNQLFSIELIRRVLQAGINARLLIFGDGDELVKNRVKKEITSFGVEEKVSFMGNCNNVSEWLQAIDVYLMPSLYEGLPVAAVEAQCSGVKCILSDNITQEVVITNNTYRLSVNKIEDWVKMIQREESFDRNEGYEIVKKYYDTEMTVKELEQEYVK